MLLYISDLDGTLLNSEQLLSEYTIRTVNRLIDNGLHFTIATARSYESAGPLIEPLRLNVPLIFNNGVYLYDPIRRENLVANLLERDMALPLLDPCETAGVRPIVFATNERGEKKIYYTGIRHHGEAVYINERLAKGDRRLTLVDDFQDCRMAEIISMVWINERDVLAPFYEQVKANTELMCHFTQDIYSKAYWLEITSRCANKRWAVEYLKQYLRASEIICFGDNLNDLPMFEIADQKCAVANGHPQLKQAATHIIGNHNQDGVARFLAGRCEEKELA